jgi:hypothetical protein
MKSLILFILIIESLTAFSQTNTDYSKKITNYHASNATTLQTNIGYYIQKGLEEVIFPSWYGTPWDYNGYTNEPNNGTIACGYFVSTTLKHFGFNLNRFDVAKKYSSSMVKTLCKNDYIIFFNFNKLQIHLSEQPQGIYIVGLSNHVGFIVKNQEGTYFIHSRTLKSI